MHILAYIPAIIMLLLVMMPMGISSLASTELAITNKRLIGRMRKQRLTVPFEDIETVRIRRGILGVIFNYGSLTIIGNGIRVRFPGITKPTEMKGLIDSAVETAVFSILSKDLAKATGDEPEKPTEKPTIKLPKNEPAKATEVKAAPIPKEEKAFELPPKPKRPQDPTAW